MGRLIASGWTIPVLVSSEVAALLAALALFKRRYRLARMAAGAWVTEGGTNMLSSTVSFSPGPVASPPPNTQTTIGQAPACLTSPAPPAVPAPIANTACVIFNSRGIPIDTTGSPTGLDAIYVTDGTAVYGITIAATGFIRTWQANYQSTASWTLQ